MKKLLLVSLLVMSISLVGCKKAVEQAVVEPVEAPVTTEVPATEPIEAPVQ
ncbi:MAG: hypothetical protein PHF25_07745 [Candidatus Margulisbacteria bacterium]|nr:hypothetical protein [Candidatus Margulisiibacteriota bacterium]